MPTESKCKEVDDYINASTRIVDGKKRVFMFGTGQPCQTRQMNSILKATIDNHLSKYKVATKKEKRAMVTNFLRNEIEENRVEVLYYDEKEEQWYLYPKDSHSFQQARFLEWDEETVIGKIMRRLADREYCDMREQIEEMPQAVLLSKATNQQNHLIQTTSPACQTFPTSSLHGDTFQWSKPYLDKMVSMVEGNSDAVACFRDRIRNISKWIRLDKGTSADSDESDAPSELGDWSMYYLRQMIAMIAGESSSDELYRTEIINLLRVLELRQCKSKLNLEAPAQCTPESGTRPQRKKVRRNASA